MKTLLPQTKIIVLTLLDSPDYSQAALAAGADFFVAKENLDADLRPIFAKLRQNGSLGHCD
jgi:DNA-binding NarL/FixJ family response regulator